MKNKSVTLTQIVLAMLISQVAAYCRGRPDGFFAADPSDRRRFFWCDRGDAIPSKCPDGLFFFEDMQICNINQGPCANRPDNFFAADPSDRRRFFWCDGGEAFPSKCPDGLIFFEDKQICNDEIINQPPNAGPCANRPDGTFVADPSDRRRFFWCDGGEAFPSQCPDGLYFFEKGQFCDADVVTTVRPSPPPRPPPATTTRRPVPPPPTTTRRPVNPPATTTRPAGPPIPTRATTNNGVRTTTRAAGPPIPTRATTAANRPPIPTRQPPAGK